MSRHLLKNIEFVHPTNSPAFLTRVEFDISVNELIQLACISSNSDETSVIDLLYKDHFKKEDETFMKWLKSMHGIET